MNIAKGRERMTCKILSYDPTFLPFELSCGVDINTKYISSTV